MKHLYALTLMLAASVSASAASSPIQEPASSKFAAGHWVKIRVDTDGIYELTYDRLRSLGFDNPERVGVYGYAPCVLLTHDLSKMPVDVERLQSLHAAGKLMFYGKGNTNLAPALWETRTSDAINKTDNRRHAHSIGATYFLADIDAAAPAFIQIAAPEADAPAGSVISTHTAVCYVEEDVTNMSDGGSWLAGRLMRRRNEKVTHTVELFDVAAADARAVYQSLLSPNGTDGQTVNIMVASYPEGFTSEAFSKDNAATGFQARSVKSDVHDIFSHSIRYQKVTVPVKDAPATYEISFGLHPQASDPKSGSALDYFALLYNRKNNLAGKSALHMFFEPKTGCTVFSLSGMAGGNWQVWDVTDPAAISTLDVAVAADGTHIATLPAASLTRPAEVVAFNTSMTQLQPEIIGTVDNQNLHSLETPDMVIVTSRMLSESAREIADMHSRLQGLDVLVVDQQQIFNEYSSGNVSPEAVRRFFRHLYHKNPGKLKGALLLGPGTVYNALRVSPDEAYVVTYEIEDYRWCNNVTHNFCNDSFFGHIGHERPTVGLWNSRTDNLRMFGMEYELPVTRLPLSSPVDIRNYYAKVEEYITNPPVYPAWGNIVVSTDYAAADQASHFANGEGMIRGIEGIDSIITVTRGATNYFTSSSNTLLAATALKIQNRGLADGAMLYSYFGHGNNALVGTTGNTAPFYDMNSAAGASTPKRYPFAYFGSCNIASFDKWNTGVTPNLIANRNGGHVAVVASCREVYQPMNQRLGNYFAKSLYTAANGSFIGQVWRRAFDSAVRQESLSVTDVLNHLAYNFVGDPMIPVYAPVGSVDIASINSDGTINSDGANTIEGSVLAADGTVDTQFDGNVILTVYDVPQTIANRAGNSSSATSNGHLATFTMDHDVIGRYPAAVKNGRFTIDFKGPVTSRTGNHRIQLYAYSSDGQKRAYGARRSVAMVYDPAASHTPEGAAPSIISLNAGADCDAGSMLEPQVKIEAAMRLPRGLAATTAMVNPVRLIIDGISYNDASRLVAYEGGTDYSLTYATPALSGGRHECSLYVLDAAGEWAEASFEFVVDNAPDATLAVSVASGMVEFDLSTAEQAVSSVLYLENLNGDKVGEYANPAFPFSVELTPGAYRAFVQLRGENSRAATPKVELFVD